MKIIERYSDTIPLEKEVSPTNERRMRHYRLGVGWISSSAKSDKDQTRINIELKDCKAKAVIDYEYVQKTVNDIINDNPSYRSTTLAHARRRNKNAFKQCEFQRATHDEYLCNNCPLKGICNRELEGILK